MTEETTPERWVYAGRLWDGREKKMNTRWIDPSGEELIYSTTAKASVVGGYHIAQVIRDGERIRLRGVPAYDGETVDDEQRALLQAADRNAYNKQQAVAAERRAAKIDRLADACADLEYIASHAKNYTEVTALINVVQQRLINAWDKRPR